MIDRRRRRFQGMSSLSSFDSNEIKITIPRHFSAIAHQLTPSVIRSASERFIQPWFLSNVYCIVCGEEVDDHAVFLDCGHPVHVACQDRHRQCDPIVAVAE